MAQLWPWSEYWKLINLIGFLQLFVSLICALTGRVPRRGNCENAWTRKHTAKWGKREDLRQQRPSPGRWTAVFWGAHVDNLVLVRYNWWQARKRHVITEPNAGKRCRGAKRGKTEKVKRKTGNGKRKLNTSFFSIYVRRPWAPDSI